MTGQRLTRTRILIDANRLNEATRELMAELAEWPESTDVMGLLACVQMRMGQHREPAKSASQTISIAPDDEWAHFIAAMVAVFGGKPGKASNATGSRYGSIQARRAPARPSRICW